MASLTSCEYYDPDSQGGNEGCEHAELLWFDSRHHLYGPAHHARHRRIKQPLDDQHQSQGREQVPHVGRNPTQFRQIRSQTGSPIRLQVFEELRGQA